MMSPDGSVKPPPEEKLLRLIRGKGGKPLPAGHGEGQAGAHELAAAVVAVRAGAARPAASWLTWVVAGLGGLVAVEALALILSIAWPVAKPVVPAVPPEDPVVADPSAGTVPALAEIPSLAAVASRPVFAASAGGSDGGSGPVAAQSGSARLLVTRLTLMGIVSGNPPQAIIQDSQTQKTYFVSIGQPVAEGAVLEQVLDNRVILNFSGEKIELNL
jgi:hypothetical protein